LSVTQAEIDQFHEFATERTKASPVDSFDELYLEWDLTRERADVNAEIARGLKDVAAGRFDPADDAMDVVPIRN
jgi:predicted transcriptional regulator